ncbi:MAG: biopolymer transporter ExbD [Bacteroidaceae bacterium]|nr:biopolymer transporter ExbD [Bacteroidaceae bacterium]
MAQVEVKDNGGKKKKGQQKKMNIHVDFTPMVDMNMLLITFFMLCTTMTESRTMDLVMPSKDAVTEEQQSKLKASEAITILIGDNDQVFYYLGEPNYQDYTSLVETTLNPEAENSIRALLLERNEEVIGLVDEANKAYEDAQAEVKARKLSKADTEAQLAELMTVRDDAVSEAKKTKGAPMVVIKAKTTTENNDYLNGPGATYSSLVDVLDEMIVCSVGKYAVVDMTEGDLFLIGNYLTKGELAASSDFGK